MRRSKKHDVHIVSSPTGVVHGGAATQIKGGAGLDPDMLSPELIEIFKQAGIKKSDLR